MSARRRKELAEYAIARRRFLNEHPICQVWLRENGLKRTLNGMYVYDFGHAVVPITLHDLVSMGARVSTEIHHIGKRRGRALLDETKWLAVCRQNHRRIEENKGWAREHGYLENF